MPGSMPFNIKIDEKAKRLFEQNKAEWFIADRKQEYVIAVKMKHWSSTNGKNVIKSDVIYMGKERDSEFARKIDALVRRNVKEKIPVRICYLEKRSNEYLDHGWGEFVATTEDAPTVDDNDRYEIRYGTDVNAKFVDRPYPDVGDASLPALSREDADFSEKTVFEDRVYDSWHEAQLAVFLREIRHEYVAQPIATPFETSHYTTDFYDCTLDCYLEYKPGRPFYEEERKALVLAANERKDVYIVYGRLKPPFSTIHDRRADLRARNVIMDGLRAIRYTPHGSREEGYVWMRDAQDNCIKLMKMTDLNNFNWNHESLKRAYETASSHEFERAVKKHTGHGGVGGDIDEVSLI